MKPVVPTETILNKNVVAMAKSDVNVDPVDLLESNTRQSDEDSSQKLKANFGNKSEHSSCCVALSEVRRRKRTAGKYNKTLALPSKRNKTEKKPTNSIRFDSKGHFPDFDKSDNATRCKNENCKFKTRLFCTKCNIHLCLTPSRNCFKNFHLLSTE